MSGDEEGGKKNTTDGWTKMMGAAGSLFRTMLALKVLSNPLQF